jgi:hypothetical protein
MGIATAEDVERSIEAAIARVDEKKAREDYLAQGEFLKIDRFLPEDVLDRWNEELEELLPHVHRNYIPRHKKGGSVIFETVAALAPSIYAVYRSPALLGFFRRLFAAEVNVCPTRDPHSCALYAYTEPGDHMGFHYDNSYYKGARYTVLFGVRDNSSCRLVCHLHTKDPKKEKVVLEVKTDPGIMVCFNGAKLLHAVTPMGENEHRYVVSMEYVTSAEMNPFFRFVSDMKDAIAYFGFRQVFFGRKKK